MTDSRTFAYMLARALPRAFIARLAACTSVCLMLGCAELPTAVDRNFGKSFQRTLDAQAIHPRDIPPAYPPLVSDAVSGKAAIERYYKSYESPPPPGNVLNIGVGTPLMAPVAK
ncbi:MAG: hypothetical protein RJA69_681 [Pseudomonadota bacterium]|jgi:hypothetical protein